jgi:hypothetical protein
VRVGDDAPFSPAPGREVLPGPVQHAMGVDDRLGLQPRRQLPLRRFSGVFGRAPPGAGAPPGSRAVLIRPASATRGLESTAVFLAPDFPSRGSRVKGVLWTSLTRSASPTLDPAGARQGSAAMRKMGVNQETAYGAGGCDGKRLAEGRPGGARPLAQLACFPRGAVRPWF